MKQEIKWIFNVHHICVICLYLVFLLCIFLNLYVLLSRDDTIFYLRLYHLICGGLMVCCSIVMGEFMWRTRNLPKLDTPHEMPTPALYGAIVLTIGIILGYSYNIMFNFAFSTCDMLVNVIYGSEYWLDAIYSTLMIIFCVTLLWYVIHRSYYGAINTHLDKITRLWVNLTVTVVWIKVVVYKGYLSHQELCKRKELEGYWCPSVKRYYNCDPYAELHGMQFIWYYINKGLLSTAIISCASEYFPVMLVAHWLSCGGAEEKAEDLLKRRQMKQGFRALLREFIKDISRVYAEKPIIKAPKLRPSLTLKIYVNIIVIITIICLSARWLVFLYYTIDFDLLSINDWMVNEYIMIVANFFQVLMFISIYLWSRKLDDDRLDAHHKAEARGDIIILFGCVIILTIKYVLQMLELAYQHKDHFITLEHCILHSISLTFIEISQWLQYFAIRRLLALSDRDIRATKRFLPAMAIGGFISGWIHFGVTFLDTLTIKYQLTDETYKFSEVTLISMIFTQTLFPADYLYAFTVACSWLELILRYKQMGTFQLGAPRLVSNELVEKLLEEESPTFIHRALHYARTRAMTKMSSTSSEEEITENKNYFIDNNNQLKL